jgi:glycosyl transferase family 25
MGPRMAPDVRTVNKSDSVDRGLSVYVLTCQNAPEVRINSAHAQLAPYSNIHPVSVVLGPDSSAPAIASLYDPVSNRRQTSRVLSQSEIAVYGTHRLAWQLLLDSDKECGLMLEDDFAVSDPSAFETVLVDWQAISGHGDIIKLFDYPKGRTNKIARQAQAGAMKLVKWRAPTAGAVAYLITRQGAEKMLSRQQIFRPVDEDFKYFWELGLQVWSITPSPVSEISGALGGSLVNSDRLQAKSRRPIDRLRGNWINVRRKILCGYYYMRGY